jgi:hypothetical protein
VDHLTVAGHGRPWIDQQWLAQLVFFGAWRAGGNAAVGLVSALSVAATAGILGALALRRGAPTIVMLMVVLGGTLVELIFFAVPRTQSFGYPLAAALIWLMLAEADGTAWRNRILLAIPLLVLWANLHGSVLLWAGVFSLFCGWRAAGRARRCADDAGRYAALAVIALATPLATPYGFEIVGYYRRLLTDPALAVVAEWHPASVSFTVAPFFAVLVAGLVLLAHAHGRGVALPWPHVALAGGLAVLGLYAIRYEVWFTLVATPLLAQVLAALRARRGAPADDRIGRLAAPIAGALTVVALAVCVVVASTPAADFSGVVSSTAIDGAAAYANAHPGARVLADDITGSALLWEHPELAGRVGFDARNEIYVASAFVRYAEYLTVLGRDWLAPTRGYAVLAVSCDTRPRLCAALPGLTGWRIEARAADGVVAVRR